MVKRKVVRRATRYEVPKRLKGLAWKKNGKMMTERQFYSSSLHFNTEAPYSSYVAAYKRRFK